ncbi:efflux RND transporter periplasmic adaptor subunit [Thioalkalicoccus limnaeus]|uniref:Efflux RND transporter periplasmic adaptor subunit n=1 Tax=Thioalkalicoccus limnaeus TaxID=120681 RepID=A0ABV4BG72_9GAMM
MKKTVELGCLIAIGLSLAACGPSGGEPPSSDTRAERILPVRVIEVAGRDLSRVVQVSAPVEPLRRIRLAARTDGVLTEVLVEEGDRIQAGEVLARIDVSEQRAELARAEARRHERQAHFDRLTLLQRRNYIDEASVEAAAAELEVASSEVLLWQTRVDFGTVTAPIDGTIVARHVEPGEAISRHEALFAIADLSNLVVRLGISELDVRNLRIGDVVNLRIDALGDRDPVVGVIRRLFPAAEDLSRLVTVEVELPQADAIGVRPGYLARADVMVDRRDGVLAVPAGAVAEAAGEPFVMVVDGDERLERRAIDAGLIRGAWREVRSGLAPGERVVSANPLEMTAGTRVRVIDEHP